MPYGEKTKEELLEYADQIFDFFIKKGAKAVVIACNTMSSVVYDIIRDKYDIKIYPIKYPMAARPTRRIFPLYLRACPTFQT